jgi:hypothetical protein
MTPGEMLQRANLVFVGVIQRQEFEFSPLLRFRLPSDARSGAKYWRVLRRDIQVETVIRGSEPRKSVPVYEIFWTGGASGDWNSTWDRERALFLVHREGNRYHMVRDWWRSIFPVTTGPHRRLPLDDSHPLWERIALMNWSIETSDPHFRITYPDFRNLDPGQTLSLWRIAKLERGFLRHPSSGVRVPACRELMLLNSWGDECWDSLSPAERDQLQLPGWFNTRKIAELDIDPSSMWHHVPERDMRRIFTTVPDRRLRAAFCRLYQREYPGDLDSGCPADELPPATIVTERGDVPLLGPWPR